jgi:hypothetical protein
MIERNGLFGVPGYRWIPARRTVMVKYKVFLVQADSVLETLP